MDNENLYNDNLTPKKSKNIIARITKWSTLLLLVVVGVFGGSILGNFIIGKFDTFDPSKYNAEMYYEDEKNVSIWQNKADTSSANVIFGQTPQALTPTQIFVLAERKLANNQYYGIYTKGYNGEDKGVVTTLGMKQDLYGYRYRFNNKGYFDYYSTGLATVVKKVEFNFGEDKYYCYEGTMNNGTTIWTNSSKEDGKDYKTGTEYKEMVGCNAENAIDYIVSTKTVISEKFNGVNEIGYSLTINLDPSTSVLNYVKKMDYMSGFGYPKFSRIEIKFEVDANLNFKNIYVNEDYKIIGMSANSKYKMEFNYQNVEER